MRRLIRQLHAWVGLALSLLLLLFGLTGSALVYKEAYWRLVYPELRSPAPTLGPGDHARAMEAARAAFGDDVRSFKLPEPGVSAYHLYLEEGEAFLSAVDHRVIDRWLPSERVMALLFDLHAHLMAGETGERVGGFVSLLGVLLAATGLVLWWPARRRFALANLAPSGLSRPALIAWHRDLGAVTAPLVLVVLMAGSGLVFYESARKILNGAFGDPVPATLAPEGTADLSGTLADSALVARVGEAFPDARIVFYYPPSAGMTVHEFRLKQPCELHPNGRSYLHLDAAGRILGRSDACVLPPGERTVHAMYPLHAGKVESALYKLAVFVSGLVLAALSAGGALAYVKKLRAA